MIPPPPKFRGSSDSESISTDDGSIQSAQSQSSQSSKKRRLIKWRKNKKENRTVKGKNKNRRAMSPLRKRGISPLVKSRKSQQQKSVEEILPPQPDGCDEIRTTRFSEKLSFYEILPREEYSSDEKRSYWLQGYEYQKIAESCMKQVEKIERGLVLKDNKYSSRGLEPLTTIASLERSKHRELEYDLVLYEQSKQREAGIFDDEKLARLAIDTTASSQLWAHVLGLRDSKMTHF